MPSAVDWSEFSVWCFMLKDLPKIDKLSSLSPLALPNRALLDRQRLRQSVAVSAGSLAACAACAREWVSVRWVGLKARRHGARMAGAGSSRRHTSAAKYVYAQFAAGALGGGTATYTTHWLDTVRVTMQMSPETHRTGASCLRSIVRSAGVRGLYAGVTPALVAQTCKTAVVFMSYGVCEKLVARLAGVDDGSPLTVWHHATAGAMTAVVASFLLCPLELIKCRRQALMATAEGKGGASSSVMSMARLAFRADGIRGLYRGLPGIWAKDIPGSFIYFGSYEAAKSFVTNLNGDQRIGSQGVFLCGMFAGLTFCVTHPIELVKTRVQVMSAVSKTRGFMRAFADIVRVEGVSALCCGLRPSVLRASLYSGVQFVTYEYVKQYCLRPDASSY